MKARIITTLLLSILASLPLTSCGGKTETPDSVENSSVQNTTETQLTVTLDKESLTLTVGETATLTATVRPISVSGKPRMWSSSDGTVATVDGTGFITAKKEGTATITVVVEDVSKQCIVTVVAQTEE